MSERSQIRIPATYMRGGTSKGVFFNVNDLPEFARVPGEARDRLLLRVIGSPDPYGKQIDGMGGGSSSTSKVVIVAKSARPNHDVDYLFGQVAIDRPVIDWSGNCGNLTAAVGAFAIQAGLVDAARLLGQEQVVVRVWQQNTGKTLLVHVPLCHGAVQETGDFELDGVTFPAAEITVEFLDPASGGKALFPTGNVVDEIEVPIDVVPSGRLRLTLINAGIPTVFFSAQEMGYTGTELQSDINGDSAALQRFEILRALGALKMGLIQDLSDAASNPHIPKIAFVAPAIRYVSSRGSVVEQAEIDVCVRALSMGQLHHAMMGTAAVALGAAAVIPGTVVHEAVHALAGKDNSADKEAISRAKSGEVTGLVSGVVTCGHPSGTLRVGAEVAWDGNAWQMQRARMSRSARIIMEGWVRVPRV